MESYIPPEFETYTICIYCASTLPSDKYFHDKRKRPCGHVVTKYLVACNKCYCPNDVDNSWDIRCIPCYNEWYHDKYINYVEEPIEITELKFGPTTHIFRYYIKKYDDGYIKKCCSRFSQGAH